jgi:predicted RNA-binding protein YlxR (DUF448 family)/ribosomal protein L7Ae-like RNA K-turn-binding protein
VGCGLHDDAPSMVRLVVADDDVAFDLAGGAFGRGAHLHARPECIARAPRGIARSFRREVKIDAAELGRRLAVACDRRMAGLLLAARRTRELSIGRDAAMEALRRGPALAVVAVDAGGVAASTEVETAVREGRAIAWKTKSELGGLLGEEAIAICAVRHAGIAGELKILRAAADAGAAMTREGAGCSSSPEAR